MKKIFVIFLVLIILSGCTNKCDCSNYCKENYDLYIPGIKPNENVVLYCSYLMQPIEIHISNGKLVKLVEKDKVFQDEKTLNSYNNIFNIQKNDTNEIVVKKIKSTMFFENCQ